MSATVRLEHFRRAPPPGMEFVCAVPIGTSGATAQHSRVHVGMADIPGADEWVVMVRQSGYAEVERDLGDGLERWRIECGELLVVPPAMPGRWRWRSDGGDIVDIVLPRALLAELSASGCFDFDAPIARGPAPPPFRAPALQGVARRLYAMGRAETETIGDPDEQLIAFAICVGNQLQALRGGSQSRPPIRRLSRADVAAIDEVLRASVDRAWRLEDFARLVGMSRCHALRAFKAATGVTPHEYLTHLRVRAACRLLARGTPVIDVALATGFQTQSHFTQVFRAAVGVTPARYRRAVAAR